MSNKRLIVGLTGTFGSGKSTVGRLFKRLGAVLVIDSDRLVDEAFRTNRLIQKRIQNLFHLRRLERKKIARAVFYDATKRKRLESILHPYVFRRMRSEIQKVKSGVVVLEIPLLFETKSERLCDLTLVVGAEPDTIVKRLSAKKFSPAEVRARMSAQWPQAKKKHRADFFIHNSGSKTELLRNVKRAWKRFQFKLQQIQNKGA